MPKEPRNERIQLLPGNRYRFGPGRNLVDAGTGQILGAAVLGLEGGEIMSMLEIAMMAN